MVYCLSSTDVPAPVWDQQNLRGGNDSFKSTEDLSGGLRKSTSISDLVKARNREKSQERRPNQGVWSNPTPLSLSTFGGRSKSSGRASAPPARPRLEGSLHGTPSSDDESSTDDESSSSFIRTLRPGLPPKPSFMRLKPSNEDHLSSPYNRALRPGTPPKPSIMRQVRRSSTSHVVPNNTLPSFRNHHQQFLQPQSESRVGRTRKLWDNNFELRSSKSEYNLNFAGRDVLPRSGSRVNLSGSFFENNRIDFASANPATIELTRETCEQVVEELNFMAIFVRKLFKRSQAAGTSSLTDILTHGISKTYKSLNAIVPLPVMNQSLGAATLPRMSRRTMQASSDEASVSGSLAGDASSVIPHNLLEKYSEALVQMIQQRMNINGDQTSQNLSSLNNASSTTSE